MPGCSPLESTSIPSCTSSVQGSGKPIEEGMEKLTARDGMAPMKQGLLVTTGPSALVSSEQLQLSVQESSPLAKELLALMVYGGGVFFRTVTSGGLSLSSGWPHTDIMQH